METDECNDIPAAVTEMYPELMRQRRVEPSSHGMVSRGSVPWSLRALILGMERN